jgi:hypothetical protein
MTPRNYQRSVPIRKLETNRRTKNGFDRGTALFEGDKRKERKRVSYQRKTVRFEYFQVRLARNGVVVWCFSCLTIVLFKP